MSRANRTHRAELWEFSAGPLELPPQQGELGSS